MKYNFIICILAVILFASCSKEGGEKVEVRFINSAGAAIRDITVNDLPVGDMEPGETSEYYAFDEFGTDSGWPDARFIGTINQARVSGLSDLMWCGTQKSRLEPGRYTVRVTLTMSAYNNKPYFELQFR